MEKLKLSNKRRAFTLVEVLAVVVILGILGLITYPILNGIIDKNKQKLYDEQMENL
ncbi:MAG: type II secretion system protein, partial [Bacilli bacterium]|nr:type II secretion system protein [Bacilli bacterium]